MPGAAAAAAGAAASHQLAFTKLTCVHYTRGDLAAKVLAHASLLPVLLIVAQAAKVYTRRCARRPQPPNVVPCGGALAA